MKLMWFHLMPYTELPDDFREKHPSVWVDIHSSLFDPQRAHHMYNDFMDELEYAAECGFDAICVNEHHSNGYGLMPSPNLIASSLARRTTDTAICVMGNSLALYNPPTRVAEEFAMIDVISGGRLIAGFPVGTPMDTCYAYGTNPSQLRAALPRGARPGDARLAGAGHVRLQRPLQPAALRQHLAAPGAEARIRRSGSPAAARSRPGSGAPRWTTSTPTCPTSATRPGRRRWTGSGTRWPASARTAIPTARASCSSSASARAARRRSICTRSRRVFLRPLPACRPALGDPAGLYHRSDPARRHQEPGRQAAEPATGSATGARSPAVAREMEEIVDHGYVIIGSPDEVAEQLREVAAQPQCRPSDAAAAVRQHGQGAGRYNTKLFADAVMPKLKDLFGEWEDRWWPQPMAQAQRADVPAFLPKMAAE